VLATIHWVRVLVAGVLSEVGVIVALLVGIAIYKKSKSPGSAADSRAIGERVGYFVAAPAGFISTGLMALWAVHGLQASILANALAVGVLSVAITIPFFLGAKPEHRAMYGIAFGLRLLAAWLAGFIVLRGGMH
jgi:hypothetical protein